MLTIITTTRDNTEWTACFIEAARKNAFNKKIPIVIVDTSSEEEYKKLINIAKNYDDVTIERGITINDRNKSGSWITDWNNSIGYCKTEYIIFCHIDILLLYKHWDQTVLDYLKTSSLISGTFTPSEREFLSEFDKIRISSSFIATTSDLLRNTDFQTIVRKNVAGEDVYVENGNISLLAKSKGNILLFEQQTIPDNKFNIRGDFFYFNNLPFYYHCAYSSRVKPESTCPVPEEEYKAARISNTNIEKIPDILIKLIREDVEDIKGYILA